MGLRNLPSDGSVWPNYMPSGISVYEVPMPPELASGCTLPIPESMWASGWRAHDLSDPVQEKKFLQVRKKLPNGRHHEISVEYHPHSHHGRKEREHILIKYMLNPDEWPTKKQFSLMIAPEVAKMMNGLRKKTKRKSINSNNESEGSS